MPGDAARGAAQGRCVQVSCPLAGSCALRMSTVALRRTCCAAAATSIEHGTYQPAPANSRPKFNAHTALAAEDETGHMCREF